MTRNWLIPSFFLAVCLSVALPSTAQEVEPRDLMVWVPDGHYKYVTFYDYFNYFKNCPKQLYKDYFQSPEDKNDPALEQKLPKALRQDWTHLASGHYADIKFTKLPYNQKALDKHSKNRGPGGSLGMGNYLLSFSDNIKELRVYLYPDLKSVMKKAFKNGDMARVYHKPGQPPLYFYHHKFTRQDFYLTPVNGNTLLVAPEREYLEKMIAAGNGTAANVMDSDAMIKADAVKEYLKFSWWVEDMGYLIKPLRKWLDKNDPDNPYAPETIKMFQSEFNVGSREWDSDGNEVEITIKLCESSKEAGEEKAIMESMAANAPRNSSEADNLRALQAKNTTIEVKGNFLIKTFKKPPEYFYEHLDFIKRMNKKLEEKRKSGELKEGEGLKI